MNLDNIETYYNNYQIKYLKDCSDDDLLRISLSKLRKDFNKMKSSVYKRLIINSFFMFREKILNTFSCEDYTDVYDKDNNILEDVLSLCDENIDLFDRLENLIEYGNNEIIKLLDFQIDFYINNYNYLMSKRNSLEKNHYCFSFQDFNYEDNKFLLDVFFNSKINSIKNNKVMEKKYKM